MKVNPGPLHTSLWLLIILQLTHKMNGQAELPPIYSLFFLSQFSYPYFLFYFPGRDAGPSNKTQNWTVSCNAPS